MPMAGATIHLEPGKHLKQTDIKGMFTLSGLYEGGYTLYVSNVGFITDTQEVTITAGNTTTLQVTLRPGTSDMQEVIVAAGTKNFTPDNLLNVQQSAMPVTVITRETIERMGSRRLDELLKEQTGLAVVSDISGGYQYLVAKDKSVADSINAGVYPFNKIRNNETGETRTATPTDYWGMENRSRHMANLRIFYSWQPLGINASFRVNYRGQYPFGDANNNAFIDRYDTFVAGYFLLNASLEKKLFKEHLSIRVTADNLLDYTDRLMPAQPGRILLAGVTYRL